jgi:hypothetical protein
VAKPRRQVAAPLLPREREGEAPFLGILHRSQPALERRHVYNSMTSHADRRVWQDVYHVPWAGLVLYVKLTVDELGRLILSMKEK